MFTKRFFIVFLALLFSLILSISAVGEDGDPPPVIGFHDYEQGYMDPWNCKAGGWAMDPDHTEQDILVNVLVDDTVVAEVTAGNYRPDLEEAWNANEGGCPSGTCAFEVSLWELIEPSVWHEVRAEAQDLETGEWFSLEATPKWLICPVPHIEAFAWFDRYSLADWPAGIPVEVTITNPDGSNYLADAFTPDSPQGWYDFFPPVDLQPGTVITASNNEITKVLVVSSLSATVDGETGTVTGIATPERTFHMRTDGDYFQLPIEQDITADPSGNWMVTNTSYLPWEWFTRGEMWEGDEDGDVTYAIWHVRNEVVEVWLAQNEIRAFDWPRDTELTFTVEDPGTGDVYNFNAWTEPVNWMEGTWAVVNADYLQLVPGMKVTVTDGKHKASTITQDIKITGIDFQNDVVYGTAPQKAHLELGSWEDSPVFRFFKSDKSGNWMVNYNDPSINGVTVDLNPGDELRLFMRDGDKDSTVWGTYVPNPRIVVSELGDWFWTTEFYPGMLDIFIYESADEGASLLWSGQQEADQWGFALVGSDIHGQDLVPGNYLVISDGVNAKGVVLERITMEVFDTDREIMAGTAPLGREVSAAAGPQEWQARIVVPADPVSGVWLADFKTIGFDITEDEMRPWSFAQIFDEDGDANEASTPPTLPSTWRDDFDATSLAPGWFWKNGDLGGWSLEDNPGFLRLTASDTSAVDGRLLSRQVQQGDFTIQTHLIFAPDTNYQFAGLVIYQDENNFLQFGRAFCEPSEICVGNGIYFDYVADWGNNFATSVDSTNEAYLRLERRGEMVTAFYSPDGSDWMEIGTHLIPSDFWVNGVGLTASQDLFTPDRDISADFDFFELSQGQ